MDQSVWALPSGTFGMPMRRRSRLAPNTGYLSALLAPLFRIIVSARLWLPIALEDPARSVMELWTAWATMQVFLCRGEWLQPGGHEKFLGLKDAAGFWDAVFS